MKTAFVIFLILFFGADAHTQNNALPDSLGKIFRQKLKALPPANDYSNFKAAPRAIAAPLKLFTEQELANTIVIIDNKIYRLDAMECFQTKVEDLIEPVTIIKDESSGTIIKKVLIYKTKKGRL
jgi:hypothetical protein